MRSVTLCCGTLRCGLATTLPVGIVRVVRIVKIVKIVIVVGRVFLKPPLAVFFLKMLPQSFDKTAEGAAERSEAEGAAHELSGDWGIFEKLNK